jgi:hypothetical protein
LGKGVPEDRVEAYAWYSVGGAGLDMDALSKKMTPEQIAQGQQRSKELLKELEEKQKKAK